MRTGRYMWGFILIMVGCMLLLNTTFNIHFFSMANFWPIFVVGLGLIFEAGYFVNGRNPGLLVPGGMFVTWGSLFFFETFTHWRFAGYTWPIYIFGVAIGLFQLYLFSGRKKGLLIPVGILTTVASVSMGFMIVGNFLSWINYSLAVPVILIIIGVYVIFKDKLVKTN